MKLLLLRHGVAEERAVWAARGGEEEARPLTEEGRRRMGRAALGLVAEAGTLSLVATSPLQRARETAEILAAAAGGPRVVELEALRPAALPSEVLAWLQAQRWRAAVALVGHEPHLSLLTGLLLAASDRPLVEFKKGGAALFDLGLGSKTGAATLLWLLTAGQARRLAAAHDD